MEKDLLYKLWNIEVALNKRVKVTSYTFIKTISTYYFQYSSTPLDSTLPSASHQGSMVHALSTPSSSMLSTGTVAVGTAADLSTTGIRDEPPLEKLALLALSVLLLCIRYTSYLASLNSELSSHYQIVRPQIYICFFGEVFLKQYSTAFLRSNSFFLRLSSASSLLNPRSVIFLTSS